MPSVFLAIAMLALSANFASAQIVVHTAPFIDAASITDSCTFEEMPIRCPAPDPHYREMLINIENISEDPRGRFSQSGQAAYPYGFVTWGPCPTYSYISISSDAGAAFAQLGFYRSAGRGIDSVMYQVLDHGVLLAEGLVPINPAYLGFSGHLFTEVRVRSYASSDGTHDFMTYAQNHLFVDQLVAEIPRATPTKRRTFGALKSRYR